MANTFNISAVDWRYKKVQYYNENLNITNETEVFLKYNGSTKNVQNK